MSEAEALPQQVAKIEGRGISMQRPGLSFEVVTLPTVAWSLLTLGRIDELSEVPGAKLYSRWALAAEAVVGHDFERAADICADIGSRPDEAYARLRAAEALLAKGRRAEAEEQLERAVTFFRSVGATRYLRDAESLVSVARTGTEP